MQASQLEWRNPLHQLHVILKKINLWTQMMLVTMQSYITMTFCLICCIWYHILHHQVVYDIIYCNIWYQTMLSYVIILSVLCDIILHGGHLRALGGCTGGERLDVHLLKPSRLELIQELLRDDMCDANTADQAQWIECKYRTSHPIFSWLQSKLAA
jgi:hypothetical protein